MNKEDVRKKMLDIVWDIYHADSADYVGNGFDNFDGHTWNETKDVINKAFDSLTSDHPKVNLPLEVGEELDEYKRGFEHDIDVLDLLADVDSLYGLLKTNKWLYDSDGDRSDHANRLIDAYRYGWKAEPEAKWYVQTPKEWWEDKSKPEYVDLDSMGISDGLKCKEYAAQFTRSELKHYHFDSDIFTLVPVVVEHD